jgi:predicted DNA-binding transcriptional regulator AlpA
MQPKPLPHNIIWLSAEGVGEMLSVTARTVRERVAVLPDFPKAVRLDGILPRWNAYEVDEWMRIFGLDPEKDT